MKHQKTTQCRIITALSYIVSSCPRLLYSNFRECCYGLTFFPSLCRANSRHAQSFLSAVITGFIGRLGLFRIVNIEWRKGCPKRRILSLYCSQFSFSVPNQVVYFFSLFRSILFFLPNSCSDIHKQGEKILSSTKRPASHQVSLTSTLTMTAKPRSHHNEFHLKWALYFIVMPFCSLFTF